MITISKYVVIYILLSKVVVLGRHGKTGGLGRVNRVVGQTGQKQVILSGLIISD